MEGPMTFVMQEADSYQAGQLVPAAGLMDGKYPGEIEPEPDGALTPAVVRFRQECPFIHAEAVGKMELEHMPSRFYVEPYRQGVLVSIRVQAGNDMVIIDYESDPPR